MSIPTLITFIAYFIVLLGIGFFFYRRSANIEDYLLGGRGMGSWVTALSAQASDMSGWLLMGLPGAIYLGGMGKTWIATGLFIGQKDESVLKEFDDVVSKIKSVQLD